MKRLMLTSLVGLAFSASIQAQTFTPGGPLGTINEAGVETPMSSNVKVFGSFRTAESCTFDPDRNLILAMNNGVQDDDGYVSLINPDGSVHTSKWIGASRDGLELNRPLGSAINDGTLYAVDVNQVRMFDLASGQPMGSVTVPEATLLNGIGVAADGTVYASNT